MLLHRNVEDLSTAFHQQEADCRALSRSLNSFSTAELTAKGERSGLSSVPCLLAESLEE